jgi:hypothetical protein
MSEVTASAIIDNYKKSIKELCKDSNPGHKAIVVYGGYMGKSFHTLSALKEIGLEEYYPSASLPYNNIQKDFVFNLIREAGKFQQLIILDSYMFPYETCKEKVPEYNELISSLTSDRFGFNLKKPFNYSDKDNKTKEIIPEGFFEIKSNFVFLVGYSEPKELIDIIPSFNFNFTSNQLLDYVKDNIDTVFFEYDNLTKEMKLETLELVKEACEIGVYDTLDYKWIKDAFGERLLFEKKKENDNSLDFKKEFAKHLGLIKNKIIK